MTTPRQTEQLKGEAKLRAELAKAWHDLESLSVTELAARNANLAEYCRHWEGRAIAAETMLEAAPAAPVELEPVAYVDQHYGIQRTREGINLPVGAKLYAIPPDAAAVIAKLTQERDEWIACHARVWKRLQRAHKAIEAMRVAGGSVEFQVAFDAAKGLVIGSELISEPLANPLANLEETSDCHGPDWTERDGEYLK